MVELADVDLAISVIANATLGSRGASLEGTLRQLAGYVASTLPTCDGVALTLVAGQVPMLTVASSPLAQAAEDLQREIGEGPSVTARAAQCTVLCPSMGTERRWRRVSGRMSRLGVRSALVIPTPLDASTVCGLTSVYACSERAFEVEQVELTRRFSTLAIALAQNMAVLSRTRTELDQLREALLSRPVIDQAIGLLRSRTGKSEAEALRTLRQLSNWSNVPLAQVARRQVEDAARRANVRRRAGGP